MTEPAPIDVSIHVDALCPFTWVTARWLALVEQLRPIRLTFGLAALSAINEDADVDADYRAFLDTAWGPARVLLAVERELGADGFRAFYEAFGRQHHVLGVEDVPAATATALAEIGAPAALASAADDASLDDEIRSRTAAAHATVQDPSTGVPIVTIDGAAFFGPVLTSIPRGADAADLFDAVRTLAATPEFTDIRRGRVNPLQTS